MRQQGDIPASVVLVVEDGCELPVGPVHAGTADIGLVGALARLQLHARRRGWHVRVDGAPAELCALFELAGLAGVLGVQPRRQPEPGEQARIDEVVQSRDRAV